MKNILYKITRIKKRRLLFYMLKGILEDLVFLDVDQLHGIGIKKVFIQLVGVGGLNIYSKNISKTINKFKNYIFSKKK
eukprot:snap_masked-scaffold_6-processed-gene-20.46-mRNA-1 protein AED:1.00 eAED:1.00 QI:0/0/0/0/1/1/2/0/77